MIDTRSALVLFSGGQDSTTCLAWALDRFEHVETVAFDYRQRHRIELDQRLVVLAEVRRRFPEWAERLGEDHFIDMGALGQISETSLTRETAFRMEQDGLPNSFVPGRNLLFFTFAAAVAWRRGVRHLVGGMCETDFSGYPDCRDNTIKSLQVALNLGMDRSFALQQPSIDISKQASARKTRPKPHATSEIFSTKSINLIWRGRLVVLLFYRKYFQTKFLYIIWLPVIRRL